MDIGEFDRLVTIRQPGTARDSWGQVVGTPVEVARVWANVRHLSGTESIRSDAVVSAVQASIRIWGYRTDITNAMQVVDGADVYEIRAVLPDKTGREWVDLVCEVVQ